MSERDLFGEGLPEQPKPPPPLVMLSLQDFAPDEDGVRRIVDWRLAEVIENQNLFKVRQLTSEHRQDLEDYEPLYSRSIKSTGGRPGTEYRYTSKQAIFVIIISRGRNWKVLLRNVIEIHDMFMNGELVARDAAAEAKVESSMAKATEAAPEIMRTFLSETFRRWEQTMREGIKDAVNENMRMPKMEFTDATKLAICKEWRRQNPTGLDLLCRDEIVDEQDQPIRGVCEIHHMKGIYRNGIEDGLPVPVWFHRKLTADRTENGPEWQQARNAHRVFLDRYRAIQTRLFDA